MVTERKENNKNKNNKNNNKKKRSKNNKSPNVVWETNHGRFCFHSLKNCLERLVSVPARISKGQGAGPEKGLFSALLDFQKRHFLGTL
jgi:hypothetical protein